MNQITTLVRLALILCLSLVAACGGNRPKNCNAPPPGASSTIRTLDEVDPGRSFRREYGDAWARRIMSEEEPLRYLALSGGGEDGAFGAGFLQGWASDNGGKLPEFEIVTGVSTGALLSTFAFIGQPEKLTIYREKGDADLVTPRLPLFALFSDSFYQNDKLRKEVARLIDHDVLMEVASRGGGGQQLLVGAVNLDTNEFRIFEMTDIAGLYAEASAGVGTRGGTVDSEIYRQRYIDAIIASTAIPVVFNPSYIDCQMYVDGGTREQVFLREARERLNTAVAMAREKASKSAAATRPPEIYAIINGKPTLEFDGKAEATLLGIGARSVSTILNANLNNDIRNICSVSADAETRISSIDRLNPEAYERCDELREKGKLFSKAYMNCLYGEAEMLALGSAGDPDGSNIAPWGSCPSRPDFPTNEEKGAKAM